MQEALVLNASYEALSVVSSRRAAVLVLGAKAISVQNSERVFHAERTSVIVPVVVRLTRFVKVPYRAQVPLTRKGVLARDGHRCVYCSATATSLDHVVPRSRGGEHTWDNVVACCARCNHQKADRSLQELGWRLPDTPAAPTGTAWRILGSRRMDPRWLPFLGEAPALEAASA